MLPDTVLNGLSLASTVNGLLACCLPTAAAVRRSDRLLRVGAVAVWPPAPWVDFVAVLTVVTGLPAPGAVLCLVGADRTRSRPWASPSSSGGPPVAPDLRRAIRRAVRTEPGLISR